MHCSFRFSGFNAETLEEIAASAKKALREFEFSAFLLGCTFPNSISDDGKLLLKKEFQPLMVKKLEESLNAKADFRNAEIEILANFNQDLLFLHVKPLFICGCYKKFSRKITQTRHYCFECKGRGCKKCNYSGIITPESVQGLVERHALPFFNCSGAKFHGSGREDKDVRMLGSGRKFALELLEPKKRSADLKKLQEKINSAEGKKIEVQGLKKCGKEAVAEMKEERNSKVYEARVSCCPEPEMKALSLLQGSVLSVRQRTPLRCIGRADKVRGREAKILSLEPAQKKLSLRLEAEAGLYVKEFISGDFGRTLPSISSLLKSECECLELDVVEIKKGKKAEG